MAITVAVTGGIGAGKSTVAGRLAARGAIVVDSDQLARKVVAPGSAGLAAIATEFGPQLVTPTGTLDRAALAAIVFADQGARRRLEGITHPAVRARFVELRDAAPAGSVVVNDIPLLVDLTTSASFHLVVGVYADEVVRVHRLVGRGLTEPDALARIAAQIPDQQRRRLCDEWLPNDGAADQLAELTDRLWEQRLVPFRDNITAGRPAGRSGPVVVPPDPSWPVDAARLRARVAHAVGGARVDHIGSTAVPGLPATDVIDLQLTVDSLDQADGWRSTLTAAGFPAVDEIVADMPHPAGSDGGRWAKRLHVNADPVRSVNLHVRVRDWPGWRWALLFRDWLTAEPLVRAEYRASTQALAAAFAGDTSTAGYAEATEPWLAQAYERGLAWAQSSGWVPPEPR